ncbi:MAG: SprT family zinc-dependent metalloprotease [Asticcacaulis sp.]
MTGLLKRLLQPAYADGDTLDAGDYVFHLKVNPRARSFKVRLDRNGDAVVTASRPRLLGDALAFARSQHGWIMEQRQKRVTTTVFAPGLTIAIAGHAVTLAEQAGVITPRAVEQPDGAWRLVTSGDAATYSRRIERYLRQQALKLLTAETDRMAAVLGFSGVRTSLFDARGRWGSCTPARKAIRYSWRLILAPKAVLTYLCAHEVSHLKHPDHSPRFWAEVAGLYGDCKAARKWLKTEGQSLFRYQ